MPLAYNPVVPTTIKDNFMLTIRLIMFTIILNMFTNNFLES